MEASPSAVSLLCADVVTRDDAQMIAEMRPQPRGPWRARRRRPGIRRRHLRRLQVIQREIAMRSSVVAEATSGEATWYRRQPRDVLVIVPLVEFGLMRRIDIHRVD